MRGANGDIAFGSGVTVFFGHEQCGAGRIAVIRSEQGI
jgi:hypothetical protein